MTAATAFGQAYVAPAGGLPCAAIAGAGVGMGPVERVCHNRPLAMPKMKTHSGAKKRFKVTATGKVRGRHAFTSHILEKKSPKRKRALGAPALISDHDTPRIKRMLGVGK
jgi:large subunit ribosomal protein L35